MIVPAPLPHIVRIAKSFFGIQDFPYYFEVRNSGMKLCTRGGMPKITIGITVLHEI